MMRASHQLGELTEQLKQRAAELGFPLAGVTPAVTPGRLLQFQRWLDGGLAGQMHYLENRRRAYDHPSSILEGCRSLVMLAVPYLFDERQREGAPLAAGHAKVARYAQSAEDYHDVIRRRLKQLKRWLTEQRPQAKVRGVVDTAPLLEREFAELAGLGWVGKNTLLLNRRWGSYFFLAALLTDLDLPPDAAHATNHCGTCTACLDHCPTNAFVEPYVLDARRCLSYITIEQPGPVDDSLSQQMDHWIFGCDVCQEVCPWNRKSQLTIDSSWQPVPTTASLDLMEILQLSEDQFAQRFRSTPLWRPRRRGMLRNAILVAGKQRLAGAIPSLIRLLGDEDELIRASAAWALGQTGGQAAGRQLAQAAETEASPLVQQSIAQALRRLGEPP